MMRRALPVCLLIAVVLLGACFRFVRLGNRPMHADEAVQAFKLGGLLEHGRYTYDPAEYHGPTLHYLALPVVRLAGVRSLTGLNEGLLRLPPALLGAALVAAVWLLRRELGTGAALCAAALTAVSPALVFYSRYYIAETLLVTFTFGVIAAGCRHLHAAQGRPGGRALGWLLVGGVCLGLMHASKETCVIAWAAMFVAAAATLGLAGPDARKALRYDRLALGGALGLLVAAAVSALLFSSLLSNPRGPLDSVATYVTYAGRAAGEGEAAWHVHPRHYYLRLLLWWHRPGGLWTQAGIVLLAGVGFGAALRGGQDRRDAHLLRFLGCYSVALLLIYSAIPYKTPWCALGAVHGMVLLGGAGAARLVRWPGRPAGRVVMGCLLAGVMAFQGWQAWRAAFVAHDRPDNPFAYAQTTRDVPALARRVVAVATARRGGTPAHVQVICPDNDYWPLPWYLRGLPRVGWHAEVPEADPADVVVISPALEDAFRHSLFVEPGAPERRIYVDVLRDFPDRRVELRPNVFLHAYAAVELWDAYAAERETEPKP
jgi:uncharacterized protein (TIGR03663 family)